MPKNLNLSPQVEKFMFLIYLGRLVTVYEVE